MGKRRGMYLSGQTRMQRSESAPLLPYTSSRNPIQQPLSFNGKLELVTNRWWIETSCNLAWNSQLVSVYRKPASYVTRCQWHWQTKTFQRFPTVNCGTFKSLHTDITISRWCTENGIFLSYELLSSTNKNSPDLENVGWSITSGITLRCCRQPTSCLEH